MSEKNIYFIKLVYEASDLNAYILFCTIINKQSGTIEGFDTVVSKIPEIHDNPERYTYRDFINKIQKLKIEHYTCEDGWYSCPKSKEGCFDERQEGCTCGADKHNFEIDQLIFLMLSVIQHE